MHSTVYTGLLCSLAAPALGAVWESHVGGVPSSWTHVDTPSDSNVALTISLSRKNIDQLQSTVLKASTPGQSQYGQWLEKEDIESQFPVVDDAPVVSWLKSNGITKYSRDGALLRFSGSVSDINKLLDTTFANYEKAGAVKLRTSEYSIPDDLADYIDIITPTVYFGSTRTSVKSAPARRMHPRGAKISASCESTITPDCLRDMYNVGDYVPDVSAGSRVAFGSFLNESASYSDLAKFQKTFGIPQQSFTVETFNGGINNQSIAAENGEANLDVQLLSAMSHPLPIHEYIGGGVAYVFNSDFLWSKY